MERPEVVGGEVASSVDDLGVLGVRHVGCEVRRKLHVDEGDVCEPGLRRGRPRAALPPAGRVAGGGAGGCLLGRGRAGVVAYQLCDGRHIGIGVREVACYGEVSAGIVSATVPSRSFTPTLTHLRPRWSGRHACGYRGDEPDETR